MEGKLLAASLEHSPDVDLEERPCILEEKEGEPDAVGPPVDHLVDAVGAKHEARDADVGDQVDCKQETDPVPETLLALPKALMRPTSFN